MKILRMGRHMQIELIPDLEHCVETAARKKHAELVNKLLGMESGDKETEEKLETLRLFLETADFRKLRTESEQFLTVGVYVRFIIYLDQGIPKYEMHIGKTDN